MLPTPCCPCPCPRRPRRGGRRGTALSGCHVGNQLAVPGEPPLMSPPQSMLHPPMQSFYILLYGCTTCPPVTASKWPRRPRPSATVGLLPLCCPCGSGSLARRFSLTRVTVAGQQPCKGTKIGKGELRVGTWVEFQGHGTFKWRHWGCG
jgi:hypothetical protein